MQKLNHPSGNCKHAEHLCVADLQQKHVTSWSGGNLRNVEPNRVIPIRYAVDLREVQTSSSLGKFISSISLKLESLNSSNSSCWPKTIDW